MKKTKQNELLFKFNKHYFKKVENKLKTLEKYDC